MSVNVPRLLRHFPALSRRHFLAATAATGWATLRAVALDWDGLAEDLADVADRLDAWMGSAMAEWTEQLAADLRQNALVLLRAADEALQGLSEEQLAELEPWLRLAADHAAEIRELAPYAAWLRARLDYFAAAREAIAIAPLQPVRPRPPAPSPPWRRPPVRQPVPPPAPVRARRARAESAPALWRKRTAASPPPPPEAQTLLPLLKGAFRAERVPVELVWIAQVESSFDPRARSPRGAAGLFQLMPATARSLGLQTEPEDERENPARSAGAAARYLRQLHARFGSWPLALAAYNAGERRVRTALQENNARTFEEIAPALPIETRMYVPRVLETIRAREGLDPARLPPPG
ncbi:MAG: lytic transglycosylase domain-containing protein [Kiritimatiellae bacterium]|nr:lytic transglycosylase domain-containing protein [Kiritimatiellia bacterium]